MLRPAMLKTPNEIEARIGPQGDAKPEIYVMPRQSWHWFAGAPPRAVGAVDY